MNELNAYLRSFAFICGYLVWRSAIALLAMSRSFAQQPLIWTVTSRKVAPWNLRRGGWR